MTSAPPQTMRDAFVPDVPESLAGAAASLRGASASPALQSFRAAAWEAFARLGLPGTKHEDFTFVSAADLKSNLTRPPAPHAPAEVEGDVGGEAVSLTFTDGSLAAFSVPEHIALHALAEGDLPGPLLDAWTATAAAENEAPAALAWALARQPLALHVPKAVKTSVHLRVTGAAGRSDHALFVRLEDGAEVDVLLESDALAADGFTNTAVAFSVAPGARLRVLQTDAPAGVQMLKLRFALEKDARAEFLSVSTGSRLARLALEADLLGPGADIDLRGAIAVADSNRAHRHVRLRHAVPDCASKQLFKAVVRGTGRSSVDGTVTVDRDAQRTDARQLLQHLLLSPDGRADAKPRLLIHADDVKCSHGATVGKTDPAQKFYLLSRGLTPSEADRMLTQAFLDEALEPFSAHPALAPARARLMDAVAGDAR